MTTSEPTSTSTAGPSRFREIEAGIPAVEAESAPDFLDEAEETAASESKEDIERLLRKEDVEDKKSYRAMRQEYAEKILSYLRTYSIVVAILIVLDGTDIALEIENCFSARLSLTIPENVLVVLAGSTAVAAIGLMNFVVKGLFPQKPD